MNNPLDWFSLIAYLGAVCFLGLFFARRNTSFSKYMFGGGAVPWIAVGISLIATSVSATTFLGNPADVFKNNMTYIMCNIGGVLSLLIVNFVFIPRIRNLKIKSAYELLENVYSRKVRLLASVFYCLHLLLRTGILLYGPALILSSMLGTNIYIAIFITGFLAIAYTWFGGIQAVIWTDVMQFAVLMGGGLVVLLVTSNAIGGFGEMWTLASEAGKTKWIDFSMDPANARTLLSAGIIYTVFEIAIRGCDQQFVQRYLSCKNVRAAQYSSFLSVFLGFLVGLVFYSVGASLYVFYKMKFIAELPEGTAVNEVFPHFILNSLPAGVTGLLVAAIMAAAMSSLDSAITALSNTTIVDFYKSNKDELSSPGILKKAKIWVIIWGIIGVLAAFLCAAGEKSLLTKALFFTSLFTGPLLAMFMLAFFKPNMNSNSIFWGAIIGMLCLAAFSDIPVLPAGWWSPIYKFSWPWNPLISLTGTIAGALLIQKIFIKD